MINLRYHIVSITAVFLALAIGLAMGTSFINRATVDQLKRQVRSAEQGIDRTGGENKQLRSQVNRYQRGTDALVADAADRSSSSEDALAKVPVLVVANDGVDQKVLDQLRDVLAGAGADVRGRLVIKASLRVDGGSDDRLAEAVDLSTGQDRATTQAEATRLVGGELNEAAARASDSGASAAPVVQRLIDAGYLGFQAPPDSTLDATSVLAGGGYRYVFVSEPDAKTPDEDFFLPVLRAMAEEGDTQVVVASAAVGDDPEATRVQVVGPIRTDQKLATAMSTVDDLDQLVGLRATVLALGALGRDQRGHYGFGDGADDSLLPPAS